MERAVGSFFAYVLWDLFVALPAWLSFKITGVVVNYWSIVLMVCAIHMLTAPVIQAVRRE